MAAELAPVDQVVEIDSLLVDRDRAIWQVYEAACINKQEIASGASGRLQEGRSHE